MEVAKGKRRYRATLEVRERQAQRRREKRRDASKREAENAARRRRHLKTKHEELQRKSSAVADRQLSRSCAVCDRPWFDQQNSRVRGKKEPPHSATTSAAGSGENSDASTEACAIHQLWRRCVVAGCTKPERPMHQVPRNHELRCAWLKQIGLPESEKRKTLFVCRRHFAPNAYYEDPHLLEDMGFTVRHYRFYHLRPDAVPSLCLSSDLKQEVRKGTWQDAIAAASSKNSMTCSQAPLRQYGRTRPRGTVTTQTPSYQRSVGEQASALTIGRNADVQVDLKGGVSVSMGTQTEVLPVATCTIHRDEGNAASFLDQLRDCSTHKTCHCSCRQHIVNTTAAQTVTVEGTLSMSAT